VGLSPSQQSEMERLTRLAERATSRERARGLARLAHLRERASVDGASDPIKTDRELTRLASALEASGDARDRRAAALPVPRFAMSLPVNDRRAEIADVIRRHQVVVLCGETGSGKTTQLPQICLSIGRGSAGMIGHTQPRRLAARSVAARIAAELNVDLGSAVGVKVRFNDQTSEKTAIKLMTDGLLLAELANDPELLAYDTIIIDEAHERSLNVDFLLGYLKRLLVRRDDLKLIVTSATIDPHRFSAFLGGPDTAPVLTVSGRTFPVEVRYRPADERDVEAVAEPGVVADAIREVLSIRESNSGNERSDVLVFLPGEAEIRQTEAALRSMGVRAEVMPLYSRLTAQEQDRIFQPTSAGSRRVILATNVAETSLTVPGIKYVVDTGLVRLSRYDAKAKVQRLPVEWVSRASANQRSGRCGRVSAGVCVRLYAESVLTSRDPFTAPEIRRTSLASVMLHLLALNIGAIEDFEFIDPPEARAIADGYDTLFELGAISQPGAGATITTLGRQLARLPMDPRIGRIVLAGSAEACPRETRILASALSIQDPRERPAAAREQADRAHSVFAHPQSDFLTLLNIWDQFEHVWRSESRGAAMDWCRQNMISHARMREWMDVHDQLCDASDDLDLSLVEHPATDRPLADRIHRALMTGLIANVCCKEGSGLTGPGAYDYRGPRVGTVSIFPGSVLFKQRPRWIMAAEVVETTRVYARTVAAVDPEWLIELASHVLTRQAVDPHFDRASGEASAFERVTMGGLVVVPRRRVALRHIDQPAARALFIRHVLVRGEATIDAPLARANHALRERAVLAAARLRLKPLARDEAALETWFDKRLPDAICDAETLLTWLAQNPGADAALRLAESDVLPPDILPGLDPAKYPESVRVGSTDCQVHYRFEPGREDDGVTIRVPLVELPRVSETLVEWGIPGVLPAKLLAGLKLLPKGRRAALEAAGELSTIASDCADVVTPMATSLPSAVSEALSVVAGVEVPADEIHFAGVPEHLRLRFEVIDDQGTIIASGRELSNLQQQWHSRAVRARAAAARARFDRRGVRSWDFGELDEPSEGPAPVDQPDEPSVPCLIDDGPDAGVRLTLVRDPRRARAWTSRGVRRLLVIACAEELGHRLDGLPHIDEMARWYQQLGTTSELRDGLMSLIVERTFLTAQTLPRSREQLQERLEAGWGRLAQSSFDVGECAAKTLEARARVAHRLASGTPRLWAASIADIREHAAYLLPTGLLSIVGYDRFREYPRYAVAMRERLLSLREDGSGAETTAIAMFAPAWKKFTGWVAQHGQTSSLTRDETADTDADAGVVVQSPSGKKGKAPLPQTRRTGAVVNVDAGVWALSVGNLPPAIEQYRWALEDARVQVFAAGAELSPRKPHPALERLAKLWPE
jgi:ATP-dependent helicase HrpA